VRDQVERDVDPTGRRHGVGVLVDRPLVERVDLGRLGHAPGGADVGGHGVQRGRVRPARNTFAPSRAKARATAPPIDPLP
jgi:hypothetical protein